MSYRAIRALFEPQRLAYVPSAGALSLTDALLARNFAASGFKGELVVARPPEGKPLPDDFPQGIDLAVVSLPQRDAPALLYALAAKRCQTALLVGAGPTALDLTARETLRIAARLSGVRVVGPSRIGVVVPSIGLVAGALETGVHPGQLALVTQSDSIATSMLDWAAPRRVGFSRVVSVGELSAVALGDVLDYLALDSHTRAILLYVERVADVRHFMTAARFAARLKPLIVVRGGASLQDTEWDACYPGGRFITSEQVYDAAFRRAGVVRVLTSAQLFDAAYALAAPSGASIRGMRAGRLAIVSNGRAPALLAADALVAWGGALAKLSDPVLAKLQSRLPAGWSGTNPIDLGPDAPPSAYSMAMEALRESREVDAALFVHSPAAGSHSLDIARAIAAGYPEHKKQGGCAVMASWVGEGDAAEARRVFAEHQIPSFATPERGVRAFLYRVQYERAREIVQQIPSSIPDEGQVRPSAAAAIIDGAIARCFDTIRGNKALALLDAYTLPVTPTRAAANATEAAAAARAFGYPVAVRAESGEQSRTVFDIFDEAELLAIVAELERKHRDGERVFLVQSVGALSNPVGIVAGMRLDPHFGPVLYFGLGGAALDVARDVSVALPPLNDVLAHALMSDTRVGRTILAGPAATEVERLLVGLSRMVAEQPAIAALETEALVGEEGGVAVVSARIRIDASRAGEQAGSHLAIRPYPAEFEETVELRSGEKVKMRPIRPEDARAMQRAFGAMDPEDIRMRLFAPVHTLSDELAARMTQIDYDREMAFVIEDPEHSGELLGGARIVADPDNVEAEFAVTVRSNLKGKGVGAITLGKLLDYASSRGIEMVWGSVLAENRPMLKLAERLGFTCKRDPDDPELMKCTIDVRARGG